MNTTEKQTAEQSEIPTLSIIIATAASTARRAGLRKVVQCAFHQAGCEVDLIIVANGRQCDVSIMQELQADQRIRFFHHSEMNVNSARLFGRQQVTSEYFCFIDDDDDFLPDTLHLLVSELQKNPTLDVAVGNGYRNKNGTDTINLNNLSARNSDLLGSLVMFGGNWLPSCAGVFRTRTVSPDMFADYPQYCEWTYFAFKLAMSHHIQLFDHTFFRINDSSVSLSKSLQYNLGEYDALKKILSIPLPSKISSAIKDKLSEQAHTLSEDYLALKQFGKSLRYHLMSLTRLSGLKYAPYTRKIALAFFSSK